jgi:hypothetical protein
LLNAAQEFNEYGCDVAGFDAFGNLCPPPSNDEPYYDKNGCGAYGSDFYGDECVYQD